MAKKKEAKIPKGKKAKEMGYVSFSKEDIKNAEESGVKNQRAYELLYEATNVSKHVQKKNKKGREINDDDIYPTSLDETLRMDALVTQATNAIDDQSDRELKSYLSEMRDIIDWSRKRHWNFSWMIIIGVIVSIIFLNYQTGDAEENVKRHQKELTTIEKWNDSAIAAYKTRQITSIESNIKGASDDIKRNESVLDTAVNKDVKKRYQEWLKNSQKRKKDYEEKLADLKKASNKDVHKMAIKEKEEWIDNAKGSHRALYFWTAFFIILIPLYIFAERPFGYLMSRYRTEAKVLGGIKKLSLMLAGGLASVAAGLQVTETVTKWSDGTTTRDDNGMLIYAMKFAFLAAALVVICITSMFLMVYSTIAGLIRNYDLIPKAKLMIQQIKNNQAAKKESAGK
ncbi:MAG: hypothetical protein LBM67_05420 [Lentimicrobiaceae bacterium]|jgi:uncharacterized membrane protein (DUF106 family)|nr:hypothetical protein [Lentimicrobiaceae bacterium]